MLEDVGFSINIVNVAGFLGSYVIPQKLLSQQKLSKPLIGLQNIMKKTPMLKQLGTNFTIVAKKQQGREKT